MLFLMMFYLEICPFPLRLIYKKNTLSVYLHSISCSYFKVTSSISTNQVGSVASTLLSLM